MQFSQILAAVALLSASVSASVLPRAAQSSPDVYPPYDAIVNKALKLAEAGQNVTGQKHSLKVPAGYNATYGPVHGIPVAGNYLANKFLKKYDLQACADFCGTRNSGKGICMSFNIFRLLVNNTPTAYDCVLFDIHPYQPKNSNVYKGVKNVTIDMSRGYDRYSGDDQVQLTLNNDTWEATDGAFVGDQYAYLSTDNKNSTVTKRTPFYLEKGKSYTFKVDFGIQTRIRHPDTLFGLKWNGVNFGTVLHDTSAIVDGHMPTLTYRTPIATGEDYLTFYGGCTDGSRISFSRLEMFIN